MAWVLASMEYYVFQPGVGLTGKVVVLKHWVTDVIASHSVTRESEICGIKLNLLEVLIIIERGRLDWIMSSIVASIEKTSAGLVMRVIRTS